jgi:hypothetical protein
VGKRDDADDTVRERPASGAGGVGRSSDLATVALGAPRGDEPRSRVEHGAARSAFDPPAERFEARGELGRGGMGRVDEAYDRGLDRPVAIKHMLSAEGVDLARFEREARITARLEHPAIVPIHDAGRTADGMPYYVMRRVDGRPLSELVASRSLAERLALVPNVLAACDAAAYAHARDVIHRDIKPSNILIGPFGETLLIDWGLAREMQERDDAKPAILPSEPELTRAGTVAGTPGFMAPEQARGETVDARADVFALGATLFYVVAGQLPWQVASATELVDLAGAGREPDWRLVPHDVPPELRAVLVKAMAGDPEQRYADAGELAADLRRFITGNLVGAYDYGLLARIVRFARRHRAAVAVALISALSLVAIGTVSIRRVVAERDAANAARALAEAREREAGELADGVLVQQAATLADLDPVGAIAVLRRLRASSTRWREAWSAAVSAWLHGVPFGFIGSRLPTLVAIAGDQRHAFAIEQMSGQISLIDLIARTRRVLPALGRVRAAEWADDGRHIAIALEGKLVLFEHATGGVRELPLDVTELSGDRRGRLLARTTDARLLEVTPRADEPRELASGVEAFAATPDLSAFVLVRASGSELHHRGRVFRLPLVTTFRSRFVFKLSGNKVLAHDGETLHAWEVRDDQLVGIGRWPADGALMLAIVDDQMFALSPEHVAVLARDRRIVVQRGQPQATQTAGGFVVVDEAGRVTVRDAHGLLRLGARPVWMIRTDVSTDGRFLLATTASGDLLAWDLRGLRPQVTRISRLHQVVAFTGDAVWAMSLADGLLRYDVETGEVTHAAELRSPVPTSTIDPDGRWLVLEGGGAGAVVVLEIATGRTYREQDAVGGVPLSDGALLVHADASLWRWSGGQSTRIGALPDRPLQGAARAGYAAFLLARDQVARVQLATGRVDVVAAPRNAREILVEPGGRAWFLADDAAWRWNLGGEPERVDTAESVSTLVAADEGVILQTANSLVYLTAERERVIAATVAAARWLGDDRVVYATPHRVVGILDLQTGARVEMPVRRETSSPLLIHGGSIGYATAVEAGGTRVEIWQLPVPHEPAALQRWLAEITNARPIPGSDAVAWP